LAISTDAATTGMFASTLDITPMPPSVASATSVRFAVNGHGLP
jgi:hypothetical protein